MSEKDSIIDKTYHDLAGYGSMKITLEDARKVGKSLTMDDVKKQFDKNVEKTVILQGYNTFVASEPREEYQMDLVFFIDLKDPDYGLALLLVDTFT